MARIRGRLRLTRILWLALLLVFVGRSSLGTEHRVSEAAVQIEINQQRFAIPGDYIASVVHDSHGAVVLVRLTVFWPTMAPLANRAPQKLELPGPQGVNLLLRQRPRDGYQMLRSMTKRGWLDENYEPGPFGLRAYVKDHERLRRTTRSYVSADTDVRTPGGDPVVLDCRDLFTWDDHEVMDLQPICRVNYVVAPDVGLTYWFYRKNLQSWCEIDRAIRGLVESFALGAGTLPGADRRLR